MRDIFQWEVRTWSRALPLWEQHLPKHRPASALGIGEREGGLSLLLATLGFDTHCTDLHPFTAATLASHGDIQGDGRITYGQEDVLQLSHADATFDVVFFKSVIGALGSKDKQMRAIREMHRVLKPGGVLLFAENLQGTRLHRWLRKRFVAWEHRWRYLHILHDRDLFAPFAELHTGSTGLLANLGRSEKQRDLLARLDGLLMPMVPKRWRTVWYGVAIKPEALAGPFPPA
ncbi:MAG: class I SAM-dependent methyltransferase [Flavobacteriales bacterium]|nr:class I SAM-dependent methyltransferase [Flavobacteriales bacterium]